jgi:hypothetical protein
MEKSVVAIVADYHHVQDVLIDHKRLEWLIVEKDVIGGQVRKGRIICQRQLEWLVRVNMTGGGVDEVYIGLGLPQALPLSAGCGRLVIV